MELEALNFASKLCDDISAVLDNINNDPTIKGSFI